MQPSQPQRLVKAVCKDRQIDKVNSPRGCTCMAPLQARRGCRLSCLALYFTFGTRTMPPLQVTAPFVYGASTIFQTCTQHGPHHPKKKKRKRKDYTFWRQFNEKPSIIPGCPEHIIQTPVPQLPSLPGPWGCDVGSKNVRVESKITVASLQRYLLRHATWTLGDTPLNLEAFFPCVQ